MVQRRLTLIINPKSGTLSKKGLEDWLPVRLAALGFIVDVKHTEAPGHATQLAAEAAANGAYGVLACGGDGTVNEVASGLINTDTALGILPAGSGNGLARHIGIPVDIELSTEIIAEDNVADCDYGTVNGRPFFCTFGMGFDAAVSYRFARKHRRGLNSYIQSAIDEFIEYHPNTYEIITGHETLTERAFLVSVCNASQYGNNAFIAPAASIQDGLLDVTIIHDGTLIEKALSGVELLAGSIGNHGKIRTFRTPELTIRRHQPAITHIDGEPTELPAELNIKCHPGALKVFIPRHQIKFIPILTPMMLTLREWGIVARRVFRKPK